MPSSSIAKSGTDTPNKPGSQSSPLQSLNPRRRRRKAPAHFPPIEIGFRSIIIYLTVCVKRRRPLLANDKAARLIVDAWQAATFWSVGRYVIMPDHVHLFCAPNTFPAHSLKKWIEHWKNDVTRGGQTVRKSPFGKVSFGTGSYAAWNRTTRNGNT
jgi:REP element-mobilizing transposase RayT